MHSEILTLQNQCTIQSPKSQRVFKMDDSHRSDVAVIHFLDEISHARSLKLDNGKACSYFFLTAISTVTIGCSGFREVSRNRSSIGTTTCMDRSGDVLLAAS